jgi:hypothetical protein
MLLFKKNKKKYYFNSECTIWLEHPTQCDFKFKNQLDTV